MKQKDYLDGLRAELAEAEKKHAQAEKTFNEDFADVLKEREAIELEDEKVEVGLNTRHDQISAMFYRKDEYGRVTDEFVPDVQQILKAAGYTDKREEFRVVHDTLSDFTLKDPALEELRNHRRELNRREERLYTKTFSNAERIVYDLRHEILRLKDRIMKLSDIGEFRQFAKDQKENQLREELKEAKQKIHNKVKNELEEYYKRGTQ